MFGFILFLAAPSAAYRRVAIPRLKELFPYEWEQIWRSTCTWQSRLAPVRPHHSASVNLMIRHMEWSCALYQALKDRGMSQGGAGAVVEAIAMDDYRPVPAAWFRVARIRSSNPGTRVKWMLGLVTRHFFSSPFVHRHLPAEKGVAVAFGRHGMSACRLLQGPRHSRTHPACSMQHRSLPGACIRCRTGSHANHRGWLRVLRFQMEVPGRRDVTLKCDCRVNQTRHVR